MLVAVFYKTRDVEVCQSDCLLLARKSPMTMDRAFYYSERKFLTVWAPIHKAVDLLFRSVGDYCGVLRFVRQS
jgi:hypothetical protein